MKNKTYQIPLWSTELITGNEEIDLQHQSLFALLEKFTENIDNDNLLSVLTEIKEYAEIHFEAEEELQKEVKYPKYTEHKATHELLIEEIGIVKGKVQNGTYSGNARIRTFLTHWLRDHILDSDQEFITFYNARKSK